MLCALLGGRRGQGLRWVVRGGLGWVVRGELRLESQQQQQQQQRLIRGPLGHEARHFEQQQQQGYSGRGCFPKWGYGFVAIRAGLEVRQRLRDHPRRHRSIHRHPPGHPLKVKVGEHGVPGTRIGVPRIL